MAWADSPRPREARQMARPTPPGRGRSGNGVDRISQAAGARCMAWTDSRGRSARRRWATGNCGGRYGHRRPISFASGTPLRCPARRRHRTARRRARIRGTPLPSQTMTPRLAHAAAKPPSQALTKSAAARSSSRGMPNPSTASAPSTVHAARSPRLQPFSASAAARGGSLPGPSGAPAASTALSVAQAVPWPCWHASS